MTEAESSIYLYLGQRMPRNETGLTQRPPYKDTKSLNQSFKVYLKYKRRPLESILKQIKLTKSDFHFGQLLWVAF